MNEGESTKKVHRNRNCGHGSKRKVRVYPKGRKNKRNRAVNPRTTNPLCLNFNMIDNEGNKYIVDESNEEIQAIESPHLNVIPN